MSEIQRHSNPLLTPVFEGGPTRKFISERVSALWSAMDTYGKPCDGALLQAWEIVTQSNRITAAEFSAGIEFFINEGGKLPAPGDFRKWIQDRRDETTVDRQQAEDTARAKADDQARIEEWDSRHPEAESWTEADYRAYISGLMNEAIEAFTSKRKSRQGSDVGGPA